jgi:hypothetical protein
MRRIGLLLVLLLAGCAARHSGTANTFDSGTYDALLTTDSVIQSTKTALAQGQFPASILGNVKTALNDLIAAYDAADLAYCGVPVAGTTTGTLSCAPGSYHAAAMAGTATPAQQAAVQADVNAVTTATAALTSAKGGT